ncbi:MAG: PEP-CTERM/exosortase system-associated acyltransferase [Candidatus Omnitrophota bacterium]
MTMSPMEEEKFRFKKIISPEELLQSYRLRFQVYCKECNFISDTDYPDGIEKDGLDEHAVHFAAFDDKDAMVGAVRLILPTCERFPIEEHCSKLNIDPVSAPRAKSAEISRLTISKLYRRRAKDGLYYEPQVQDESVTDKGAQFLRRVRPMAFGLYRQMYQESKRLKVRHWLVLMERSLWFLLKIHGFVFRPIGAAVDFYGEVTPYLADIVEIEKNVKTKFPQFFDYFMENLEPELRASL